jgi:hypothetical protein
MRQSTPLAYAAEDLGECVDEFQAAILEFRGIKNP